MILLSTVSRPRWVMPRISSLIPMDGALSTTWWRAGITTSAPSREKRFCPMKAVCMKCSNSSALTRSSRMIRFFSGLKEGRLRVDSICWMSQRRMDLFWMWRNSTATVEQYVSRSAPMMSRSFILAGERTLPAENSRSRSCSDSPNSARVSCS